LTGVPASAQISITVTLNGNSAKLEGREDEDEDEDGNDEGSVSTCRELPVADVHPPGIDDQDGRNTKFKTASAHRSRTARKSKWKAPTKPTTRCREEGRNRLSQRLPRVSIDFQSKRSAFRRRPSHNPHKKLAHGEQSGCISISFANSNVRELSKEDERCEPGSAPRKRRAARVEQARAERFGETRAAIDGRAAPEPDQDAPASERKEAAVRGDVSNSPPSSQTIFDLRTVTAGPAAASRFV
jgi:hypothetical protein